MAAAPLYTAGTTSSRPSLVVLLAAVALVALTVRLGVWQLDRATHKQALQRAIQTQEGAAALPPDALPRTPIDAEHALHRRIRLHGRWLPQHTVYLDNRQMRGRPGFFVLTPMRLPGGDAVLVQRGWLPRDFNDRTRIAPYTTPDGDVELTGRIAVWPSRLADLGEDAPGPVRQNLDLAAYAAETRLTLRPLTVVELVDLSPGAGDGLKVSPDGLLRDWPRPAVDVAKHHGYAAQWFGLAALTAGLYVWFQLIQPRRRRVRSAAHG
jgi:surfeit locus 1 family protein